MKVKPAQVVLGALAAGALGGLASSAAASPKVQFERCIGLDRFELGRAVERELATSTVAEQSSGLVISASCADGVSATVRVTEAGSSRTSERTLALGEVPEDLRPRLLALVAVELIEAWIAAPPVEPAAQAVASPAPSASSSGPSAAPAFPPSPSSSSPSPLGVTASAVSAAPRGTALDFGVGARFYLAEKVQLLQLFAEVDLRWLQLGVVGAIGDALTPTGTVPTYGSSFFPVELGRFHPYLLALSARRSIECLRGEKSSLCLAVRLEGGVSAMYAAKVTPGVESFAKPTLFAMGALGVEARRRVSALEGALRLEVGLSEGADFYVFDQRIASFDGVVAALNLGIRWAR